MKPDTLPSLTNATKAAGMRACAIVATLAMATTSSHSAPVMNRSQAIAALRSAAAEGSNHSQLMLASLLEDGVATQRAEAWQWYRAARASADPHTQARIDLAQARLADQVAAQRPMPFTKQWPLPGSAPAGRPEELQPGYHCHMQPFGQRLCHSGIN